MNMHHQTSVADIVFDVFLFHMQNFLLLSPCFYTLAKWHFANCCIFANFLNEQYENEQSEMLQYNFHYRLLRIEWYFVSIIIILTNII